MDRLFFYLFLQGILVYIFLSEDLCVALLPLVFLLAIGLWTYPGHRAAFLITALVFMSVLAFQMERIELDCSKVVIEQSGSLSGKIGSFVHVRDGRISFVLIEEKSGQRIQCFMDLENWDLNLDYGQVVRLSGSLEKPEGLRNPGGFDYRRYLLSRNIGFVFYGRGTVASIGETQCHGIVRFLVDLRRKAIEGLKRGLDPSRVEFAKGILFGEKGLDEAQADLFSRVGISHVLAVSGLHVGILYAFALRVFRRLALPIYVQLVLLAAFFFSYAFWCDFSVSVLRACGMALVHLISRGMKCPYDSIQAMSFVGCITMLINPYVVQTPSFILSYAAAFSIAVFYPFLAHKARNIPSFLGKAANPILLSGSVFCFGLPIVAGMFHRVASLSVLLNVFVVPLAGIVLVLLIVSSLAQWTGIDFAASVGYHMANVLIGWIYALSERMDAVSWQNVLVPAFAPWRWVVHYLWMGLLWGYLYTKKKWSRRLALLLVAALVWVPALERTFDSQLRVTYLDVGQGDAALIELPGGETVLVDGGGSDYRNVGEDVVFQALLARGIKKVDVVVCTHTHTDHLKGLEELIGLVEISAVVINNLEGEEAYGDFLKEAKKMQISVLAGYKGMEMSFRKGVDIHILYPFAGQLYQDPNNSSLVFRMDYGQVSFLFTGDVENSGENMLLSEGENLKSQVIKIAHHGSDTSSSKEFMERVDPAFAVLSVGENNPYGHPGYKTLELLKEKRVQYYRTDNQGAVVFATDGNEIKRDYMVKE